MTSPPRAYRVIAARTKAIHHVIDPVSYDCVMLVIVRSGGAILHSEFGTRHVNVGDVIVLDANTLCGTEPEGWLTITTVYLDRDFVVDQVFWQYAEAFAHRLDAKRFLDSYYTEPAQVIRLGENHAGLLMPWLDELSSLSAEGLRPERFYRAQSLLFAVLDVVVPHIVVTDHRVTPSQRATTCPSLPRHRQFAALRTDARQAARLLRDEYQRPWTLTELADAVHLSRSQLGRVFVEAFGKSPIAYLAMVRAEQMAGRLRTADIPIATIAQQVGWCDADFAARQFKRSIGVTPSEYRSLWRAQRSDSASG